MLALVFTAAATFTMASFGKDHEPIFVEIEIYTLNHLNSGF